MVEQSTGLFEAAIPMANNFNVQALPDLNPQMTDGKNLRGAGRGGGTATDVLFGGQ